MNRTRIVLADDHRIVLDGLKGLLSPHFELVGTAVNGRDVVRLVEELKPDVAVLDISMPLLNGIDATRQLRERHPNVKVVMLTMHPDTLYATRALEAGASGYVLKHAASDELVSAVEAVLRGETFISPSIRNSAMDELLDPNRRHAKSTLELTPRQREVLQLLAEGKSAKEIASILEISPRTVETHKYKMMDDLGVKTSAQLVQYAIKHGLVSV
jgi:DNA-binding NarL/FixJ family response regulator